MTVLHESAHVHAGWSVGEQALLLVKQQELAAKRAADREFRRALRDNTQVPLLQPHVTHRPETVPPVASPPRPTTTVRTNTIDRRPKPVTSPPVPGELVDNTLAAAEAILAAHVRPRAQARARLVYRALVQAAYTLIHARRQSEHTTTYTWFTVLDVLPVVTGLSHATCERALGDLRETGLIATRRWYTRDSFLNAETGEASEREVCGGVFLAVVLRPSSTRRAFVHAQEFLTAPRDLAADRRTGRTAWQCRQETPPEVREPSSLQKEEFDVTPLVQWALENCNSSSPDVEGSLTSAHTAGDVVWGLSAILSEHPQARGEAIERAAQALVRVFRDPQSMKHYCRLLHRAVQREFTGFPAFQQLQHTLQRVLVDMTETPLHRPGGRVVRELQRAGWWDAVYRAG